MRLIGLPLLATTAMRVRVNACQERVEAESHVDGAGGGNRTELPD